MDRKVKLVFKILGLNAILLIYISNRPASNVIPDKNIWMNDYAPAIDKARAENKSILIYFPGPDWCKPCTQLGMEVFDQEKFKSYARENLVLLKLDPPRHTKNRQNTERPGHNDGGLAARLNQEGDFPLVLVIDKNENVLAQTGYRDGRAASFVGYLQRKLGAF